MLQNWLKPVSAGMADEAGRAPESAIGRHIVLHHKVMPDLKGVKLALIGLEEKSADAVRRQWYAMEHLFPAGALADLGNLRKSGEPSLLIPAVYELLSGKIVPILIGGDDADAKSQFLAYQDAKNLVNMVAIDETLDLAGPYGGMLAPRHPLLFHFGLIGYQTHQTPRPALDLLEKLHFEAVRLGKSRTALEETEPCIRDADLVAIHLSSLKSAEAPGVGRPSPSGYFLEEACQLARYAGMSDKLSSLGIYGLDAAKDPSGQSAMAAAQLIWYFAEGFFNRKRDFPVSKDGLTEYIVTFPGHHYQLTFWKSTRSGRWWMQVPVAESKRKYSRHRLVPCSLQDYQLACRGELPDRLMEALKRFG